MFAAPIIPPQVDSAPVSRLQRTKQDKTPRKAKATFARRYKSRNPEPVIDATFAAISEQTCTIVGAQYAELGVANAAKDALLKTAHR